MPAYPLGEPPITPSTEELTLLRKQGVSQSIFTGAATIINNFAQWQVQLGFKAVRRGSHEEREMLSWLLALRGSEGSFLYYPADSGKDIHGKWLLTTGFAESSSINVTGWTGSEATGLEAGDYFSIGDKLFCITSIGASATTGHATVTFEPPLRGQLAAGTPVNFADPHVEVRLSGGDGGQGHNKDPEFTYIKPIQAVEVL